MADTLNSKVRGVDCNEASRPAASKALTRALKVYTAYQGNTPLPQIRLEGKWLEALSFSPGDAITVHCEKGRLVIEKSSPGTP